MKRICLAIGASRAEHLEPLPGALTAAEEVGDWARRSGFDVVEVVTDEDKAEPVTISRLRNVLTDLLRDDGEEIDAFVLHFAGHGFRLGAEQNLWLPTDWSTELRAIAVEPLRSKLYRHGIRNLTIFSDACRALPNDIEITELTPDGILGRGPYGAVPPVLDRYNAVMDGQQAYMIPGDSPEDARCVFSTAVLEALWGHRDDAFDQHIEGKVTPESLDLFLKRRLQEIGERYRLKCRPENVPGTPRDHLIYFDRRRPPAGAMPAAPIWPVPVWERPTNPVVPSQDVDITSVSTVRDMLGADFGRENPAIDTTKPLKRMPAAAKTAFDDLAEAEVLARKIERRGDDTGLAEWNVGRAKRRVEAFVADSQKDRRRREIRRSFGGIDPHFAYSNFNLIVIGGEIRRIWANRARHVGDRKGGQQSAFQLQIHPEGDAQIIIEFEDGIFASAVMYSNLVTVLTRDAHGVVGWACMPPWSEPADQLEPSIDAITKLQLGELTANQVDDLAVKLRGMKHVNPTLGALSSYLYDYSGDVDSIRRMAYFYADQGQPIPFDVAFMGLIEMPHAWQHRTVLVPAVKARKPDRADRRLPQWVKQATPEIEGIVGGAWPIFRQGWDFVSDPTPPEAPAARAIHELSRYLLPSPFTSFKREGAEKAIEMLRLRIVG